MDETIGYLVIETTREWSNPTEYAGHDETVSVPAGRYPIVRGYHFGHFLSCKMPGELAHSFFLNRIGSFTSGRTTKGGPAVARWQPYGYEVARMAAEGRELPGGGRIELESGIEARAIATFEDRTLYGLFRGETQLEGV